MKLQIFKFEVNSAVELTPLRKVRGCYGPQWIAKIDGKEYFLPGHQRLNQCLEQGIKVKVVLKERGSRYKETDYRILKMQRSLDDF